LPEPVNVTILLVSSFDIVPAISVVPFLTTILASAGTADSKVAFNVEALVASRLVIAPSI